MPTPRTGSAHRPAPAPPPRPGRRGVAVAITLSLLSLAAVPAGSLAQSVSSKTSGLVVGAHFEGASMKVEDSDRSTGGGGGVMAGWVFGNGLGAFAQFDRSNIDVRNQPSTEGSWGISQLDAGLRYYFRRPASTVVPWVQAAGTYRDVRVEDVAIVSPTATDNLDVHGFGVTAGGGVDLHVTPSVAFEFGLLFSFGKLDNAEVDGVSVEGFEGVDVQSARFNLGLTWWPVG